MSDQDQLVHNQVQRSYFDEKVALFKRPIPAAVQKRTRTIVALAGLGRDTRVLDVATGCGVLIEYIRQSGVPDQSIVGCDLSKTMLAEASQSYPGVTFWHGDFLNFPISLGLFDVVFFNACFGNFLDQEKMVIKARQVLAPGGRIVISHPMGGRFVKALSASEPELVPHLLPDRQLLESWSVNHCLTVACFDNASALYVAILKKPDLGAS